MMPWISERTEDKVNMAIALYTEGYGAPYIGDVFRVSSRTIYNWFKSAGFNTRPIGEKSPSMILRDIDIAAMRNNGEKLEYLAEVFNLTKQRISQICGE